MWTGRCTNTDCQDAPTHQLSNVTDSYTLRDRVREGIKHIKDSIAEQTKERSWGTRIHGKLPRNLDEKLVDIEQPYRWLKSGDIKGETESTVMAAEDQAIRTNYFKNKLLKGETDSKSRLCKQRESTTDHLTYAPFWRRMNT